MDPIALPMTIPELRVDGAPVLVTLPDGRTVSGVFLSDEAGEYAQVWTEHRMRVMPYYAVALDLHHPNGERIADLILRPSPPTADRETLEGIRDLVLRAVSA